MPMGADTDSRGHIIAIDHVQLAMPAGGEDAARRFEGTPASPSHEARASWMRNLHGIPGSDYWVSAMGDALNTLTPSLRELEA